MRSGYLLLFRAVLAEILLLHSLYAPEASMGRWWIWLLLAVYAAVTAAMFFLERRRQLPAYWMLGSFFFDIGMTSVILHATGGFSSEFYVAYFLVILSTCFNENLAFSFVIGGVACVVYGAMAFPGPEEAFQPFYLLRLSLLLATAFFSATIADHVRRVERETAAGYEKELEWLRRLSQMGQTLARILHEIKTPLGTISLSAEYLRECRRQDRLQDLEEHLAIIEGAAERASAIVRDYLEFCRPSDLPLEPLAVQEPLTQALEGLRLRLEDRDVALEVFPSERAEVLGSRRHLVQLFTIVLDNACNAMPQGGKLSVSVTGSHERARVDITDTGVGMTPELQSRICEPFATGQADGQGTGLGLAIARWIVRKHGGELSLRSAGPGQGATAAIHLPLRIS